MSITKSKPPESRDTLRASITGAFAKQFIALSARRQNPKLAEHVRVVEIDPGMTDLPVLHFHHRAAMIDRLSPRRRDVLERTAMRPGRAPPDDDVGIAPRRARRRVRGKRYFRCPIVTPPPAQ